MIDVNSLCIDFDNVNILDDLTFSVAKGTTLVVLGKNGCGKSLLLKAIAGLLKTWNGSIHINGRPVYSSYDSEHYCTEMQLCERPPLAYVFQKGGLFDSMDVYQNIAFGLRRMGMPAETIKETVCMNLERVGLAGNEHKLPSELSGGMQKRVGLARALSMEPEVLLYDDPTAGLDPLLSDSIADVIVDIKDSLHTTSIVVTHDLFVTKRIADYIGLIYNGKFVFFGNREEFFSSDDEYVTQFIDGNTEGPIDIY